jgi:hypothetical protein
VYGIVRSARAHNNAVGLFSSRGHKVECAQFFQPADALVYGAGVANTAPTNIYGHLLSAPEFYWPLYYIAFVIVCDF